jgi:phospholipid/cholesterol/gamma-HCH transport system substrate-binding protein
MPRTRSVAWAQLKLGIIGIIAALLLVVVIVALGGTGGFPWQRYPLKTQLADAGGLKSGGVVRLSGKDVGTVTSVEFAGPVIEVTFDLTRDVRALVTTESIASVGSLSLLGESMIDITSAPHGTPLPDWAYVRSSGASGLGDLTTSAAATLTAAQELVQDVRAGRGTIGKLFTDDAVYSEMNSLVRAAADVAEGISAGRGTIGGLARDPGAYQALRASVENLRAITARVNSGQGALGRLLNDDALGQSIANTTSSIEQATANIDKATARLGRGEGTLGKLMTDEQLYQRLNSMAGRVDQIVTNLESGQGTVGRLLRDQQLYENMNRAIAELRELFADVRKDPKKYLNVRVSIF